MKQTTYGIEQLSSMTKVQLPEAITGLQNSLPTVYRFIPAVAAKEEYTDEQGIKHPAVPAVPAQTIQDQILAGTTYSADIAAIDAKNASDLANFEKNPDYASIKTAKDNAAKFDKANEANVTAIAKINTDLIAALNGRVSPSQGKALRIAADVAIENIQKNFVKPEGLTYGTDGYPVDYDLSVNDLPTFTPAPYPDVDTYFTDGKSGNFPVSFLVAAKKAPSAPKVKGGTSGTTATDGTKKEWNDADVAYIKAQLAAGEKFSDVYNHLILLGYSEGQAKGKINTCKKA